MVKLINAFKCMGEKIPPSQRSYIEWWGLSLKSHP